MFGKRTVVDMIERSAENDQDRRRFLKQAGLTGLGVVGAGLLSGIENPTLAAAAAAPSDGAVLNFALNLEYLEAEFYSNAVHGHGIPENLTHGKGNRGRVSGGRAVNFQTKAVREYAREIAGDELDHVRFLRGALGAAAVSRPHINIKKSFTSAAQAAGLIGPHQEFDPYANENNFLLAAFIFEDVGVTAYKGAAPLINNKTYLEAAAGILAVEAYHAGIIRTTLYQKGLFKEARAISGARDSLDGKSNDDRGIGNRDRANLVPTDKNGLAFSRSAAHVLNVAYLNPNSVNKGGFFPDGVNGSIHTSGGS